MAAASTGKKKTKTAAKKTAAKGKTTKKTKKETTPVKNQHREVWIIILFFSALILTLSVLGIKGVLLEALSNFTKGLLGFGAIILPIALFASSLVILFAHGKPVASKLICILAMPVLSGMIVHLIFCNIQLTAHVIPKLYETGIKWDSGGVIAGSLAALLAAAISEVGAIVVIIIAFVYCCMCLAGISISDVLDYFVGARDEAVERREVKRREKAELEAEEEKRREEAEIEAKEARRAADEARRAADEARRTADEARRKADQHAKELAAKTENAEKGRQVFDAERGYNVTPKAEETKPQPVEPVRKTRPVFDVPLEAEMPGKSAEEPKISEPTYTVATPAYKPDISAAEFIEEEMESAAAAEPEPFDLPEPEPEIFEAEHFESYEEFDEPEDFDEAPFEPEPEPGPEPKPEIEEIPETAVNNTAEPDPASEPVVVDTHQLASDISSEGEEALLKAQKVAPAVYEFPPVDMLNYDDSAPTDDATEELRVRSHKLADTLQSFGVKAQIVNVIRGPSITRYEIMLDRGVKFSRLTSLQDDIALALGSSGVRIAAIPDKSAVGIEVPNKVIQTVYLREVLTSKNMADNKSKLAFALGKDITGTSIVGDIGKMPHMLIAGTTGSGKSVCINSIIVSMLYRASPEEVKLIMIDPKMVELGTYNGIPHLLVPVVTDPKKAAGALNWAVMEMDRRYKQLFDAGARDLDSYNRIMERSGEPKLPRIVIIIDELADLMMLVGKEIEESICRIAQKARAAGMHLVIATQRPSADVLTGLMKSNISSRIAFAVSSQIESRIILDQNGAEKLIGRGDMLFFPLGYPKPVRVQGCYLSTEEVEEVTEFIKAQGTAEYSDEIIQHMERSANKDEVSAEDDDDEADELFFEAVDIVVQSGQASATMLQRKLRLGYARASRIIDQMETRGIIGPYDGARPRQLLISKSDWQEMKARRSI